MLPNNIPEEKKGNPGLAVGVVFIAVGIAMMGTHNMGGGVTFFILGILFLLGQRSSAKRNKAGSPPGNFPSRPEIRERQATAERKLRKEALAPDERENPFGQGTPSAPMRETPPAPMQEPAIRMSKNELEQRKEELRGLLESGIITKEEYQDRLRKFR
jgi:hypothetical protein